MNKKQRNTYSALFAEPIRRNILWNDVVSLVIALGGQVLQGNGSRVRFDLNDVSLNIHSPHPQKELKRYQVKAVREFLVNAGVDL
jgi:HicA toxin of bacterial toxin-antitoxin,